MMGWRWRGRVTATAILAITQASVALAQDFDYTALRNDPTPAGIGEVIDKVARLGRGKHHFLLTYCTTAPGVVLPARIRDRNPLEITIVLEWQYWDLQRIEDRIQVTVSFDGEPARIVIPLAALTYFSDPAAAFAVWLRAGDSSEERCSTEAGFV